MGKVRTNFPHGISIRGLEGDANPTFVIQADTDSSPAPRIEIMRGDHDTWGAGNYNDWRIENNNHLRFFQAYSGASAAERFEIGETGAVTFNNAFTFPTADGSNGQVLITDGNGAVTWGSAGGTDSFLIFGEESDEYLNEGGAGNAHGFAFSYGGGVQNTTRSSTGEDFGILARSKQFMCIVVIKTQIQIPALLLLIFTRIILLNLTLLRATQRVAVVMPLLCLRPTMILILRREINLT